MSNAPQRYLLARRLKAISPALAFRATHPTRAGQFRIDIPAGLDAAAQQAYLRDRQVVAALGHPHIQPLIETAALPDGTPICISPWPPGSTLQDRLDAGPALASGAAAAIVTALADALAAAHAKGISHGAVRADQVWLADGAGEGAAGPWLFGFGARHLLGPISDLDAACARDGADLAALAARLEAAAAKLVSAPAVADQPEPEPPAFERATRRIAPWVGLGVGATAGAVLAALVVLPARPVAVERSGPAPVRAAAAPAGPAPVRAAAAPAAPPAAARAAAAPVGPAAKAPAVATERVRAARAPRPVLRAAPRPRAEPPRRGLVWSARAQRLVQVDEQGLALDQPDAPAAGGAGGAVPAPPEIVPPPERAVPEVVQ